MTPADMDFGSAKAAAARDIALAFGVPPLLLGLPGDNTRTNYAEANRALWRQTVIPLVSRTLKSFNHWLAPTFGAPLRIDYDVDRIEALAQERAQEWSRIDGAGFLTQDEKREAAGYGRLPGVKAGAAPERRYSPSQSRDDHGRWTPGGGGDGQSAGNANPFDRLAEVISICVAGSKSIATDQYGNSLFKVTYDCPGGQSFVREGRGRSFPGIVLNPFR